MSKTFNGNKINLLIIGAQKAGTTSLYHYLRQHKKIFFPSVKEITYFVDDLFYSQGEDYYHSFYSEYDNQEIIGSSYVHMLSCEYCPERVYKYNSEMKFIVMLRDPIERAYSAYNYAIKNGWENKKYTFLETLRLENERLCGGLTERYDLAYFYNGLYHKHLTQWMKYFPADKFLLIRAKDLKANPELVLLTIFNFLKIAPQNEIDTSRDFNMAGTVKSKMLQKFLLNKESNVKKTLRMILNKKIRIFIRARILPLIYRFNEIDKANKPLNDCDRVIIAEYFREDLKRLRETFGLEL